MSPPRGRKPENGDLEKYVYWNNGTLTYRRSGYPRQQLGTDIAIANEIARQINIMINGDKPTINPIEQFRAHQNRPTLLGGSPPLSEVAGQWFTHWQEEIRPAKSSKDNGLWRLNRINASLGSKQIHSITTADCATLLDSEKRSEYPKIKSLLVRIFKYAKTKGLYPSQWPNPAAETGERRAKDKERKRMTAEQYTAIYERAPNYLRRAMSLVLYTLLRRSDLVNLRLDDSHAGYFLRDNALYVIPSKSQSRKRKGGPSRLRWELREHPYLAKLIQQAREESLRLGRCPFVICTTPKRITGAARKSKIHHAQVLPDYLTKEFAKVRAEVMAETNLFEGYTAEQLPGIHEIRALGSWLLKKSKADQKAVQELLDHTDERMTEHYQSDHEVEWVTIGLKGAEIR